jgi:tetratricopeptide (TPR) repeat protein
METNTSQSHPRAFLLFASIGLIALVYLVANIVASQVIFPPLMFRLIALSDSEAPREFLADLDPSSALYQSQRSYLNSLFNNVFDTEADINNLNSEIALAHYEKLLILSPNNPQLHVKIGLLHKEKGQLKQAQSHFETAQRFDPWIQTN